MPGVLAQVGAETANGTAEFLAFIIVGGLALGSALAMVLMRNAVHSALMLVLNFFSLAVLYAILEAQFLAVVQIIVYAGAIVVLFLFVLMLLGVSTQQKFTDRIRGQKLSAVLLGVALFVALAGVIAEPYLGPSAACNVPLAERMGEVAPGQPGAGAAAADRGVVCQGLAEANAEGNVRGIGMLLFTDYVWPFEVTSVLLVIAALGAMVLGKRKEPEDNLMDRPVGAHDARSDQDGGVR